MLAYKPKSKNQEHITPDRVFDIIEDRWHLKKELFFDPVPIGTPFRAPIFFNGLYLDWDDYNYINPPFEKNILEKFVDKAVKESQKGKTSILLLPVKTDQVWFHKHIKPRILQVEWIEKRLKFKNNKHHHTDPNFLVKI